MFYQIDALKRGGRFYLCWVADSWPMRFATITQRQLWSQDIRKICNDLRKVITNESGRPLNRFSLRLSSKLLHGLVRLYERKATVLLSNCCILSANVMKNINKKWHVPENPDLGQGKRRIQQPFPQLENVSQIIVQEERGPEQNLEEMLQNSRNVVANVQEITLKESVIPELLITAADGFGEENPNEAAQLAGDRTLEVMLHGESFAHHSGLDQQLDITSKSHDKTRPPLEPQMERISEHDITMFEKEIPELPDIPIPDLPIPQPEKFTTEVQETLTQPILAKDQPETRAEKRPQPDIVLEELEDIEMRPKRRKLKQKLIIDKKTVISSDVIRARINNVAVELRCQNSSDEIVDPRLPSDLHFRRPCHAGRKVYQNISYKLNRLFLRNLDWFRQKPLVERETEEIMARAFTGYSKFGLEKIPEDEPLLQFTSRLSPMHIDQPTEVEIAQENLLDVAELRKFTAEADIDISSLPTQKIEVRSKRSLKSTDDNDTQVQAKRQKLIGYTSFRKSREAAAQPVSVPVIEELEVRRRAEVQRESVIYISQQILDGRDSQRNVTAMLQEAGLADIQIQAPSNKEPVNGARSRNTSEHSETPLGSLDRTKVSLGDSEQIPESIVLIRNQWGTEGTMMKIVSILRGRKYPVTVQTLIENGPIIPGYKRITAAKCLNSLMKLMQHGFIRIRKYPHTSEIKDVVLGRLFD